MKKSFLLIFFVLSIFLPNITNAENSNVSGFIPGQIWYSKDDLIEGETVDIHTAIWNGEKNSLSTKVEFYDKNVILGTREIVVAPSELKDVYVSWKITSGDHVISAKIISSLSNVSGKKEKIVLNRISTSSDKQSVSTVVKNDLGEVVSGSNLVKTQIDKVGSEINNIIPKEINNSFSDSFNVVDNFRNKTSDKVDINKEKAQEEVSIFKNEVKEKTNIKSENKDIQDSIKKPLAYIKLFLFSVLSFIFGNKFVFYALLFILVFYLARFIYRKIRNR